MSISNPEPVTAPVKRRAPARKPKSAAVPAVIEKPFLRFYHTETLRAKTFKILVGVEQAPDATRYRNTLSDLILELTDSGLEYYFLRPLKFAKVNFVVEQSANMGMNGVKRVMSPVIHSIIGRMDQAQLLGVCAYIRELML